MTMSVPEIDLAVLFRVKHTLSKQEAKEEAAAAEAEYSSLIKALNTAGFRATGRKGDGDDLLVLIWSPWSKTIQLMQREKYEAVRAWHL